VKKRYTESWRKGTFYIQQNEGRLIGVVTSAYKSLPKHVTEGNTEERLEGRERRGRRRKQVLDDFQETRRYKKLKEKL